MHNELIRLKYGSLPGPPDLSESSREIDLQVIFTDLPKTAAALATARTMARGLGARITLVAAQVVPFPLPLADPDVPVEFTERALQSIAVEDTTIEIYLCRDRNETIRRALRADSVVIVGARKWRWWPSWERQLTRVLRRDGRRVLVVTV